MSPQTPIKSTPLEKIIEYLTVAASTIRDLADSAGTPFLKLISGITFSLLTTVQTVKKNKDECLQLLEKTHVLLYAIITLHTKSEEGGALSPATLGYIGQFTETLQKIHLFVRAQQEKSKIRSFFQQSENNALLRECNAGLEQALDVFKVHIGTSVWTEISNMQRMRQETHEEIMELISALSDGTISDHSSSLTGGLSNAQISSNSLLLLPSKPKIFHGRESELQNIITIFSQEPSPRITILGPGGIGKTSLARAALHHPAIAEKYQHCFFISCESAHTSTDIITLLASHLNLSPDKNLAKKVLNYFAKSPQCLLVLDNFETPWEPAESRSDVEELLSHLTDIEHLALILTMRGAERPAKVRWTRPFLLPLLPLNNDAARETFVEITDDVYDDSVIEQLLLLTNNLPLAIDLIAHLADSEGCDTILSRWDTQKTSLLSEGSDRRSNLDISIALSISSPRVASCPGAKDLISLLSILPDGLSDADLLQSGLPISDLLSCKATLLRTSLAYVDYDKRLKVLVPIREYMKQKSPASPTLVRPLSKHFHQLLELYKKYQGMKSSATVIARITANLGNIVNILFEGLTLDNPDLRDTIYCVFSFNAFIRQAGHHHSLLMDHVSHVISELGDHKLQALFIVEMFNAAYTLNIPDPENLINQAINHFHEIDDPADEAKFYSVVGEFYLHHQRNPPSAIKSFETALKLARLCGDTNLECSTLNTLALMAYLAGDYALAHAQANKGQALAESSANLYEQARALAVKAMVYCNVGDYRQSIFTSHWARELLELCGLSGGDMDHNILGIEAQVHAFKSEYTEARSIYVQLASVKMSPHREGSALMNIASMDILIGANESTVHQSLDKAIAMYTTLQYPVGLTHCDTILAALELREGHTKAAQSLFLKCINLSWAGDIQAVTYCLDWLADIHHWGIEALSSTSTWAVIFLAQGIKTKGRYALYKALCCLGDIFLTEGDNDTALSLFTLALEGFAQMDIHRDRGHCMFHLGDIFKQSGDPGKAIELWATARPLFERSSQMKMVQSIDERLHT